MSALWEDASVPGTLGLGISAKQISPRRSRDPYRPHPQGLPLKGVGNPSTKAPLSDCRDGIDH